MVFFGLTNRIPSESYGLGYQLLWSFVCFDGLGLPSLEDEIAGEGELLTIFISWPYYSRPSFGMI